MGNCSSAKKPVRADASKAVQSAQTLIKNENINPNLQNTAAASEKPIAGAQQDLNDLVVNGIQKIKNFKIKFVNLDDSYYPNKKQAAEVNQGSPIKSAPGSDTALVAKLYPAETLLRDCVLGAINNPSRKNLSHFNVARYKNFDLEDKMGFKLEELMKEGDETTEHVINLVYTGLRNFPLNAREYMEKNTNFYATINYNSENNRELVVFAKDVLSPNYIKIHKVYNDIFDADTNEIINEHTTISNGLNYFYVSGAGIKGLSKSFMRIKLDSNSQGGSGNSQASKLIQPLADMPEELQLHVMIYVPDNYIFIVGGQSNNDLASNKVYYYDIKNNSWDKHSELKNGRVEHSLCLVNDEYLYAFFGHKNNKVNDEKTIERISLRRSISKEQVTIWDQITIETFDLGFFTLYAVGQYKNAILLLNVDENKETEELEDNKERNLIFSLETNKLSLYSSGNIKMLKGNKALAPLGHSKNMLIDQKIDDSYKLDFFERAFVPIADNILVLSPYNHHKEKTNLVIIKDGVALNEPFSHV